MTIAAVNIFFECLSWAQGYISLGTIPRVGISRYMFHFIRNCQMVLQNGCVILYSRWCMKVSVASHP